MSANIMINLIEITQGSGWFKAWQTVVIKAVYVWNKQEGKSYKQSNLQASNHFEFKLCWFSDFSFTI